MPDPFLDSRQMMLFQERLAARVVEDARFAERFGDTARSSLEYERQMDQMRSHVIHQFEMFVLSEHLAEKDYTVTTRTPLTWMDHLLVAKKHTWWAKRWTKRRGGIHWREHSQTVRCEHKALFPQANLGALREKMGQPVLVSTWTGRGAYEFPTEA